MKAVFADSVYFFALLNARDTLHPRAVRFATQSENSLVTTAWIITEVADGLCARATRESAVRLWDILQSSADVDIVLPSSELFAGRTEALSSATGQGLVLNRLHFLPSNGTTWYHRRSYRRSSLSAGRILCASCLKRH